MPRTKQFDEKVAMEKALNLFWEKGYEATSLSDLTDCLGIGKGSFYSTFGSKKELFTSVLSAYQSVGLSTIDTVLAEHESALEGINEFLNMHVQFVTTNKTKKGCFIANTTTACSDDGFLEDFLEDHNNQVKNKFNDFLNRTTNIDQEKINSLSDLIVFHITGISVMSKVIHEKERYEEANKLFLQNVSSIIEQ